MTAVDDRATFAFVDLAGFTAVTEAHGDCEAIAILRSFRTRVEECLGPGDELVKTIGDAVMLRFPTPTNAVVALRRLLQQQISAHDGVLLPRAGAHHGRAVAVDGDYYGAVVNLASRIAGHASAGQLLVTGDVANAAQALGVVINHTGTPTLRNVSEPVDLWDLCVDLSHIDTTTDVVCRMRVSTNAEIAIALDWSGQRLHFCGLPCVARFASTPHEFLSAEGVR